MKLSIVIPALDEEEAIEAVAGGAVGAAAAIAAGSAVREVEVIVVDDGSTDRTAAIAAAIPGVRVVSHPRNLGYGRAIQTGFGAATGELLGFLDGDGTCEPAFFAALCREVGDGKADIALGSRLHGESQMPAVRRAGNLFFALLVRLWSGRPVSDSASGMRVIAAGVWPRLLPLPDGLDFTPAMSCRAIFDDSIRIVEIPMPYRERAGRSKLSVLRDGLRFLGIIVTTALTYRPFSIFAAGGGLLLLVAVAYSIYPMALFATEGDLPQWMQYRLVTVLVISVCGLDMICAGWLAQRLTDLANFGRPRDPTWLQRLVERWLLDYLTPIGACLVAAGVLLNTETVWQYVTTGHIDVRWYQVVVGGLLVTAGVLFLVFDTLHRAGRLLVRRVAMGGRAPAP